jgi:hypothetical protein
MMTWAGVACLVIGPSALLAQVLVTPVSVGGDPAGQVADAASDLSAMRWVLVLDAPLLLFVPAVLIVGAVAGARRSRIAAAGAAVAFIGTLAAVFLLANDILLFEAASSNEPGAIGLVNDYQHNMLFGSMLVLYLAGQVIGCVLLAFALWRKRAVPCWAAVAVGAFPIVGLVFSPVGAVLALAGFGPAHSRSYTAPSSPRVPTPPPPRAQSAKVAPVRPGCWERSSRRPLRRRSGAPEAGWSMSP